MHIFLTGAVGVGKSTLIERVLASLSGVRLGGFFSVKVSDIPGTRGSVYLTSPAGRSGPFDPASRILIRGAGARQSFPEAFERCGLDLLRDAEGAELIMMDEVGRAEADAPRFCARVRALLDSDVPILGVVQLAGDTPLQTAIRTHPAVRLVTVTEQNRDELYAELYSMVRRRLNRRIDSAGVIAVADGRVLMIENRHGRWSFPKGHIEPGETAAQAAVRETREETGITVELVSGVSFRAPSADPADRRSVYYFPARPVGGSLSPQLTEVSGAAWQPVDGADALLRFEADRAPLARALAYFASLPDAPGEGA